MFDKFDWIANRYEELSEAIVQPEVIADMAKYQACLKERSQLEPQVQAWQRYQRLLAHIAQAEEMRADPDLAAMAQEELDTLLPEKAALENELRILLLPRDPDDDRSVIIEVRGGAGGEEAALFAAADAERRKWYGDAVYLRGLIEFTNYCKNNCYYCGLRCSNRTASRYRLGKDDILESCRVGASLGFNTFVLQGGEDPYYTDELLEELIRAYVEDNN